MPKTKKRWREARGGGQALPRERRGRGGPAADARRKEVDAKLNDRIAEAEKAIAATRSSAMANLRSIAVEPAGAIVERLTGVLPASEELGQAVSNVLKR